MAIVPFNRGPRPPADPLAGVSEAHKLMALGQLYQAGMLTSGMFEPPPEQPNQSKQMKDFVEGRRKGEERPDRKKDIEEEINPGEEIVDPERGPQSGRTVKRL